MNARPAAVVAAVLALALGLTACAGSDEPSSGALVSTLGDEGPYRGSEIDPPFPLPVVTLQDTDQKKVSLSDVMGPVTVMFFGYTNCPDVCNTQMAEIGSAVRRLESDAHDKVKVVFVTTDPQRDDAETLRDYLDFFPDGESFVGLTGEMSEIRKAANGLGVALTGRTKVPGGYEVGHGSQLIGFGADRAAEVVWTVGTPVGDLREDLTALAAKA